MQGRISIQAKTAPLLVERRAVLCYHYGKESALCAMLKELFS